jgi:DNA-binding response OmpR family regulator
MSNVRTSAPSASICTALLVSNDANTIQRLSESMQQLAISTEVCAEADTAPRLISRRQFGAIVVDLQLGDRARTLLRKVRSSPSSRTAVVFAISDSDSETAVAFKDGSNFVLRKPLSKSAIEQSLRAAYGLILREQRRYFRCSIDIPVEFRRLEMEVAQGRSVNISEGGIAIIATISLKPGVEVQIQFTLPGHDFEFVAKSAICWCNEGHMGLRFMSLSLALQYNLREWLSRRLEQSLPDSVAAKFRSLRLR